MQFLLKDAALEVPTVFSLMFSLVLRVIEKFFTIIQKRKFFFFPGATTEENLGPKEPQLSWDEASDARGWSFLTARPSHLQGSALIGSQFLAVFKGPSQADFKSRRHV